MSSSLQINIPDGSSSDDILLSAEERDKFQQTLGEYYAEHEEDIKKCMDLDLNDIDKYNVESIVRIANVVLDGLVILGNAYPIVGVAVYALHTVATIELTRRDNDRKVLAVRFQIQSMMCTLFQLRDLKYVHIHGVEKERAKRNFQRLVERIEKAIKRCGSDLHSYASRKFVLKMIFFKNYEECFIDHVNTFVDLRSELQTAILAYMAASTDAANAAMAVKMDNLENKVDRFTEQILRKLDTLHETQVLAFLNNNGGANNCVSKDDLLTKFLSIAGDVLPPSTSPTERLPKSRDALKAELGQTFNDILEQNALRFENLLAMQNNNLERFADRIEHQGQIVENKIEELHATTLLILEQGKLIRKSIGTNSTVKLKDPELQRIWDAMGLKRSVKAKHFVLTLRDHLLTDRSVPSTPYNPVPTQSLYGPNLTVSINGNKSPANSLLRLDEEPDPWPLKYIDVAHVQPIVEAMDEDGSSFISVKEANAFSSSRPKGWSLLQWMAYWAAGWHLDIMNYQHMIYNTLLEMYQMVPSIHPANRAYVDTYLNDFAITRVEALLRSTKAIPDSSRPEGKLTALVESYAAQHEQDLKANLEKLSYVISSAVDATLVAGSARIETWIYPLLHLILRRHLAIIGLSRKRVLHVEELMTHSNSLLTIFELFDERRQSLEAKFSHMNRDISTQFESFAYGMFLTSYRKHTEIVPAKNTLSKYILSKSIIRNISGSLLKAPDITPSRDLEALLTKGNGEPFQFESTESTLGDDTSSATRPDAHPLEGSWTVLCLLANKKESYGGLFSGILKLTDGRISGHGDVFYGPITFQGDIENACSGYTGVDIRILTSIHTFCCKGRYDHDKDSIQGEWRLANESDQDLSRFQGYFHFARTPPDLVRFRNVIDDTDYANTLGNLARRRWIFSTQAILYQVQGRLNSWEFWRSRIQEKNDWIEITTRFSMTNHITRGYYTNTQRDRLIKLWGQINPTRARIYEKLTYYLMNRRYHRPGYYACDFCDQSILFSRYTCIQCVKDDFSEELDFCVEHQCIRSLPPINETIKENKFIHDTSHTLLRSVHLVYEFELATMIPQARLRSERTKKIFRVLEAKAKAEKEDIRAKNAIEVMKSSRDIKPNATESSARPIQRPRCICCHEEVTLPCWVCATCAIDTIICQDCEVQRIPVPKIEGSISTTHSHNHHLLRIQDSSIEYTSHGMENSRLEHQLQGINAQLIDMKKEVATVVETISRSNSLPTEYSSKSDIDRSSTVASDEGVTTLMQTEVPEDDLDDMPTNESIEPTDRILESEPSTATLVRSPKLDLEDRIISLEARLEERMTSMEAKVDSQLGNILSLLQRIASSTSAPTQIEASAPAS